MAASSGDSVLPIKVHLLHISPMIWRRVLVPEDYTLHQLHGVIQTAMGWEGYHLFEFRIRAVEYTSPYLQGKPPSVPLEQFHFRQGAKFTYIYDMGDYWEHEIRVEQRIPREEHQHYPVCTGGSGACPPEECGGPTNYLHRRDGALGLDALDDLKILADFVQQVVLDANAALRQDEGKRWEVEEALERSQERQPYLGGHFSRRAVNQAFRQHRHETLMHQQG